MKDSVWVVILVIAVFSGFSMGYSLSPMIEVGMIGGGANRGDEVGLKSKVDEATEEYYRNLAAEDE